MTDQPGLKRTPERRELDRLLDIQEAIAEIQGHPRFLEGKAAWDEDKYFRGYCERQLGIIGEAASILSSNFEFESKHPDIPWHQVKALRNILVHMYWDTDPETLWGIIEKHVPVLKAKVDEMIEARRHLLDESTNSTGTKKKSKLLKKLEEAKQKDQP